MECFTHVSSAAVGICKNCGRGICRSCARDLPAGLACSDGCATEIEELREINQRAKQIYGVGRNAKRRLPLASLMWGAFALLFGGLGVYEFSRGGRADWFLLLFGLLCAVLCVVTYRRMKELKLNC
jgi:hypothetical protein